ncbi:O-antigen ligase family protein [Roseinatronobacter sp.]
MFRRVVLLLLGGSLGLGLLMNGSTAEPYRQISFLALSVPVFLTVFVHVTQYRTRMLLRWVTMTICVLLIWGGMQIVPLPFSGLAHPVWDDLIDMGLHDRRYISVAPAQTLASLPSLVLPFLVFAAVLNLCKTQEDTIFAWGMLAVTGVALAAVSAALHLLVPQAQFFSDFDVQHGRRFSGIFVNANMTAAFFALVALVLAGYMLSGAGRKNKRAGQHDVLPGVAVSGRDVILCAVLFLIVIGIIATRSRAGTTLGLGVLTVCVAGYILLQPVPDKARSGGVPWWLKSLMAAVLGLVVLLFFGEPMVARMGDATQDLRWCAMQATWAIFLDRPVTGSGFGTFAEAFPQYRDGACLGTSGIWQRAHNSYLEFLAGFGAMAIVVLAMAFGILLYVLVGGVLRRKSMKALPVFGLGALGYMAGHSYFDFPLQIPGIAAYFAALLGVACAASLLDRQSAGRRRPTAKPNLSSTTDFNTNFKPNP